MDDQASGYSFVWHKRRMAIVLPHCFTLDWLNISRKCLAHHRFLDLTPHLSLSQSSQHFCHISPAEEGTRPTLLTAVAP